MTTLRATKDYTKSVAYQQQNFWSRLWQYFKDYLPTRRKFVNTIAKIVAITVAIGSGITGGVACAATVLLAGGGLPLFVLVGIAGFIINFFVYWRSVQKTFGRLFVKGVFHNLTAKQKAFMALSLTVSISAGLAVGAITYTSTLILVANIGAAMGCSAALASSPWIGILAAALFAVVVGFATASLMFNNLHEIIKKNKLEHIKQFFYDLTHLRTADDKPASTTEKVKFFIKGFCQISFLVLGTGIALFAAITTLGAWWKALNQILVGMMANPLTAKVISAIIVMGLTTAARIPFAIKSSCRFFIPLGNLAASAIIWCGETIIWAIKNPTQIWPTLKCSLSAAWNKVNSCFSSTERTIETIETALDFLGIIFIIGGSLLLNAIGNGAVAEKGGNVLEHLLELESQTAGKIALSSASIFSFGVGIDSIRDNEDIKKTHAYRQLFADSKKQQQLEERTNKSQTSSLHTATG